MRVRSVAGAIPPAFLYKYAPVNLERIRSVLVDKKVWFAEPRALNDPFDCRIVPDLSSPDARNRWGRHMAKRFNSLQEAGVLQSLQDRGIPIPTHESVRGSLERMSAGNSEDMSLLIQATEKQSEEFGVFCFAENPDNLPMWAHYADNHEGVCYRFDLSQHVFRALDGSKRPPCFPFTFLGKVAYRKKYRTLSPESFKPGNEEYLRSLFLSKSDMWEYEGEWRAIMRPRSYWREEWAHTPHNRRELYQGPGEHRLEQGLLSGVILGVRMCDSLKRNVVEMARKGGVEILQAKLKEFEYGLRIEPYSGD